MRPKLLEIKGLQSFTNNQIIDFEQLGETGLFGIFGPTGSGKSTILDAITFALYGRVKRAEGGTQGIINSCCETASVSYTFDLMKDGTRKTYRVERTYRRRKKSQNACEPKIVRLIELTEDGEIPLCDKAMEVTYYIRDLLGLSNEDFTRAVVLPQNSFQEFLLLNNSERRGMLERIFYLEEYGKQLVDKLGRKMSRLKSKIDELSGELRGYTDATDDSLKEAEKAVEEASAEKSRVEKELKSAESKYYEAKEVWSLIKELDEITCKEGQHKASAEEVSRKRLQLEKAMKAEGLLDMLNKSIDLKARLNETIRQLEEVMSVLPGVIRGLDETKRKYESIRNEASIEQPKLVGQRTRLVDALAIKAEIAPILNKISDLRECVVKLNTDAQKKDTEAGEIILCHSALVKKLEKLNREMEGFKIEPEYRQRMQEGIKLENEAESQGKIVNELESKRASIEKSIKDMTKSLDGIKTGIQSTQKSIEEIEAKQLNHESLRPGDKEAVLKSIEKIHLVQGLHSILKLRKNELDKLNSRIESLEESLNLKNQKSKAMHEKKSSAFEEYERCKKELEKAVGDLNRNTAYTLSKDLLDGKPCPVCGSTEHPMPAAREEGLEIAVMEHNVEELRKALENAEKTVKKAEWDTLIADEQVKIASEQIAQTLEEKKQKIAEYEADRQRLPEKLRTFEPEQIYSEVEKAGAACDQKLKAIAEWEAKCDEYKETIQKLNNAISEKRISEKGVATEFNLSKQGLEQLKEEIIEAAKKRDSIRLKYAQFLEKHGIKGASQELERLSENDRKMDFLQKEIERIRKESEQKGALAENLREELRLLNAEQIKLEADIGNLEKQKAERAARIKSIAGDENIDIENGIQQIEEKLAGYARLEKQYLNEVQNLEKENNNLGSKKSLLENQKAIYSESFKNNELQLEAVLVEKGFTGIEEVEESIIPADGQRALNDEICEYDQKLVNILAQKQLVQIKLNSRRISEEEWNCISTAFAQAAALKEELTAKSEVAKSTYEGLRIKHKKWTELRKAYNDISKKQDLFEQIQKILKAEHRKDNSFIDYIAEERLRYVAAKASETLGLMTKYRYALELDVEAGFIIRDNANGGVHRMVTSLSGGEIFLTSLSLALALSEQIQLKGQSPLEFFFLDEGFGTLDHELLDTVIDALERLSSSERVVGLISHVPELKSRIGRRLVVTPPTMQGEGSKVSIEKA